MVEEEEEAEEDEKDVSVSFCLVPHSQFHIKTII